MQTVYFMQLTGLFTTVEYSEVTAPLLIEVAHYRTAIGSTIYVHMCM